MYCAHDNRVQVIIEPEKRRWCLTKLHVALWDHVSLHVHVNIHIQYCLCTCTLYIMLFYYPSGLSPDLQSMEQIRRIMRPTDVPDQGSYLLQSLFMESCVDMSRFFFTFAVLLLCVYFTWTMCIQLFPFSSLFLSFSSCPSFSLYTFLSFSLPLFLSPFPSPSLLLLSQVYSVISSGLTPIKRPSLGERMTEVYPSRLGQRLYQSSFANTTWIWSVVLIRYNRLDVQY